MHKIISSVILTGLLVAGATMAQGGEKRVALVIGNGQYTSISALANPANDARAIATTLETCGFEVLRYIDLDLEGMDGALRAFAEKIPAADCALFFFAGHGIEKDGMNYLVPVTREPKRQGEIRSRCLNAEEVLTLMDHSSARVRIILLDACRDNPLPAEARNMTHGLAPMEAPRGTLIAFATSPGNTASDGKGANSPFTESLIKYLPTPGVEVEALLKRVTDDVLQQTQEIQSPWRQSNLRGEFYFVPGAEASPEIGPAVALVPAPPAAPSLVGHLQVAVNAPAARVQVDGEQKGMASLEKPLEVKGLPAGTVRVRVDADGYDPLEKMVEIHVNEWTQEPFVLSKVIVIQPEAPHPPAVVTPIAPPATPSALSQSRGWGEGSFGGETRTLDFGSGVKLEMVWCPPGNFVMGSAERETGRFDDEGPQYRITLTRGFWMGKYEVTQAQWQMVMGNNPSKFKGLNNPVEQVSWDDCHDFFQKLNAKISGTEFRLPTEAEWEYACRAGTATRFSFGNDETDLTSYAWYADNSSDKTHPVGGKRANEWGLHDMHGNVWEWCQNWKYSYSGNSETDPSGPVSGKYRLLRGGAYETGPELCRSANRRNHPPNYRSFSLGFRVARSS